MKSIVSLSLILIVITSLSAFSQSVNKESLNAESVKVEAYYFHNTVRCITCKTVEEEAKSDLKSLYGNEVTFQSLNLEENATKAIAKKLNVSGQTLLIVKGDKKIDLTNEGFLYARTNPVKLKSIIKKEVDALINKN